MGASISSTEIFSQHLLKVLRAHPEGLSEFELIQILGAEQLSGFDKDCLGDSLSLFQTHFFLFNTLYQLRDNLWAEKKSVLNISALCIQLLPANQNQTQDISHHDPLRNYYLDMENLKNTDKKAVEELLNRFWGKFIRNDERQDALAELDLSDPVDWRTIKTQHRRLTIQHHPDRGGNESRLQTINAAMDILSRANKAAGK